MDGKDSECSPGGDVLNTYQGVLYPSPSTPEHLAGVRHLDISDTDWIVASYPKSGTTWLQEIMYLISRDGDTTEADLQPNYLRVPFLDMPSRAGLLGRTAAPPRVLKTHLLPGLLPEAARGGGAKVVTLTRDPRDTAVSYYYFYRANRSLGSYTGGWERFCEMFAAGRVAWGCRREWARAWRDVAREYPATVLPVTYEALTADLPAAVRRLACFLGKSLPDDAIERIAAVTSFDAMRDNPRVNFTGLSEVIDAKVSPFMRRGKVGDWRTHFTGEQSELFSRVFREELSGGEYKAV